MCVRAMCHRAQVSRMRYAPCVSWLRRVVSGRAGRTGAALVAVLVGVAVIGPWLSSAEPGAIDLDHGLTALGAPLAPAAHGPLGTDPLGRDVWARLIAGAGGSLGVAGLATALALLIGVTVGVGAGYAGGRIDRVLMRLVDLVLAFPALLLAILLAAVLRESALGGTSAPVIITLALVGWTSIARVVRARARVITRADHVEAARALGASSWRVVVHHVLPSLVGIIVVLASIGFAQNLLAESALSYLGLGPPPPAPTWGRMIAEAQPYSRSAPQRLRAPGLAIGAAVAGFQLLGAGLAAAVDPRATRPGGAP